MIEWIFYSKSVVTLWSYRSQWFTNNNWISFCHRTSATLSVAIPFRIEENALAATGSEMKEVEEELIIVFAVSNMLAFVEFLARVHTHTAHTSSVARATHAQRCFVITTLHMCNGIEFLTRICNGENKNYYSVNAYALMRPITVLGQGFLAKRSTRCAYAFQRSTKPCNYAFATCTISRCFLSANRYSRRLIFAVRTTYVMCNICLERIRTAWETPERNRIPALDV